MLSIKTAKKLPDSPGVYFFTRGREILYIGKATSLRDRVRSYFLPISLEASRGPRITQMLALATGLRHQHTDSVLEALLLESALIKKHQPKYNALEKDDKSYWYVVITKEDWPRVLMVRGKDLNQGSTLGNSKGRTFLVSAVFGPFPNAGELHEALRLIRKIFPFRDRCRPLVEKKCFNAQIGLCPGVCAGEITAANYRRQIDHLKLLLAGRVRSLIATLTREMKITSRRQDFEKSVQLRDQIRALKHIQDVSLIKNSISRVTLDPSRIEAYDIAHLGGSNAVGVMVVAEDSELKPNDYRKFKVSHGADDLANLREVIVRRFHHPDWPRPDLIVVDGGGNQLAALRAALAAVGVKIPAAAVIKDERHRPKQILRSPGMHLTVDERRLIFRLDGEAHRFVTTYHRQRRRKNYLNSKC